ncbi:MAG: tRNA 4-thiouridine(8) synthase ThiI [Spirochaetaceae bacterium]|nr:tRNA 4-thiouridine(8) synthase ThiI [Spirochaetaceae bacterium]
MKQLYLLRIGELALKKGTKRQFEQQLKANLKKQLECSIEIRDGRFYLESDEDTAKIEQVLGSTFGLAGFHLTTSCAKNYESIRQAALNLAAKLPGGTGFKVEARRTDKGFALTSYQLAAQLGGDILTAYPSLKVDVKAPSYTIVVEVRHLAFLYGVDKNTVQAAAGLPVGSSGRGIVLLSGGIDSPVAAYLMMKRGLSLTAVHFHTPPYTSPAALAKVQRLAEQLAVYNNGKLPLYAINFTPIQLAINKGDSRYTTLFSRAAMMQICQKLAGQLGAAGLITGESLGQVASQTLAALTFTDALAGGLVLRPCIGMDKNEIIAIAKKINTYTTSIEAETDCCSLFAPEHPIIRPHFEESLKLYEALQLEDLINETVANN